MPTGVPPPPDWALVAQKSVIDFNGNYISVLAMTSGADGLMSNLFLMSGLLFRENVFFYSEANIKCVCAHVGETSFARETVSRMQVLLLAEQKEMTWR